MSLSFKVKQKTGTSVVLESCLEARSLAFPFQYPRLAPRCKKFSNASPIFLGGRSAGVTWTDGHDGAEQPDRVRAIRAHVDRRAGSLRCLQCASLYFITSFSDPSSCKVWSGLNDQLGQRFYKNLTIPRLTLVPNFPQWSELIISLEDGDQRYKLLWVPVGQDGDSSWCG